MTEPLRLSGAAWTTTWSVIIADPPANQEGFADRAREAIEAQFEAVEGLMSRFKADSVVARFNRHASSTPFPVPPALLPTIALAIEVGRATGGAYDLTVAPLMDLWGFGAGRGRTTLPDEAEIAAVRARVGQELLTVIDDPPALQKSVADLELDLSSIAKGYGVDQIAAALEALGAKSHMVEIGGDIRVGAPKPDGGLWRIGIERPLIDRREIHRVVELSDMAVVTSGEYRNIVEIDGRRMSHTIDPRSGRPASHPMGSVTVFSETAQEADAWATALNALGPASGLALADELGLAVLFLTEGEDGIMERESVAFERLFGTQN